MAKKKAATTKGKGAGTKRPKLTRMAKPLVPVVFLTAASGYSKGEIAGFDKAAAADLVKRKVAKNYHAPKTKPEPQGTVTK